GAGHGGRLLPPAGGGGGGRFYCGTRLPARHYLPRCVRADVTAPGDALDVTAKVSDDGKILQLQVVNLDGQPVTATLDVRGFTPGRPSARVVELAGRLEDANTAAEPERVTPRGRDWRHQVPEGRGGGHFPGGPITILRVQGG